MIDIYVDGSCLGSGEGGFGVVVFLSERQVRIYNYREEKTTNNRMEIQSLLVALEIATQDFKDKLVMIYSDSAYCVNMFNSWIRNWAMNGWTRSRGQKIENLDLVKDLYKYAAAGFPNYRVAKVSGHSGIIGNELADAAATNNQSKLDKILKENGITIV